MSHCKHMKSTCEKETIVNIESRAHARAIPTRPCNVDFDVELDVKAGKCCHIEQKRVNIDRCGKPCSCTFEVTIPFDIDARIKGPAVKRTQCPVRLEVEADHRIECEKPKKICKPCCQPKNCSTRRPCRNCARKHY